MVVEKKIPATYAEALEAYRHLKIHNAELVGDLRKVKDERNALRDRLALLEGQGPNKARALAHRLFSRLASATEARP